MPMVENLKVRVLVEYEISATTPTIGQAVQGAVEMAEGRCEADVYTTPAGDGPRLRRRKVISAEVTR